MDNTDSFVLHKLDSGTRIRTILTGTPDTTYPRQVVFAEDSDVVVGGSDHGILYVFDRRTGSRLDTLRHAEKGLVQTVTVRRRYEDK